MPCPKTVLIHCFSGEQKGIRPMAHFCRLIACIGALIVVVPVSYGKDWRGIIPLHSTRQDVTRILGPTENSGDLYNLSEAVVLISYSSGTCEQGGTWNVPRDTVQTISVSPRKVIRIAELQLKLSDYEIIADTHLPGILYYNSAKEGVHITTDGEIVRNILYLPAADESYLRCQKVPTGLVAKDGRAIESHNLFDSYGKLPWSKEKQHLDLFGRRLQEFAGALGYIVIYNGRGSSARDTVARANRAKAYLRRNHQLQDNSIEIVKGDRREEFTLELYLVPRASQKRE
jgi:hypothetical protein